MTQSRLSTATEAAYQTGKELLALFDRGKNYGEIKSDHTLVTEADRLADRLIQGLIQDNYPEDGILSEENATVYPMSEHVWIVDPLDGTVNFSHGLHYWGVSIAHLVDGKPQDGAIYFPVIDELYTASRREGAFLNGIPLSIKKDPSEELFPLFVHCSRMHQRFAVKTRYKKRSLGSAAYHLCLVAKNTAVLALESTPKIWDFAAGWLLIEEAGGAIKSLEDEQPFPAQPGIDYGERPFSILAARSAAFLQEAREGITPLSK
jgi:myo-inositol-1(or 4)-monophosphatase